MNRDILIYMAVKPFPKTMLLSGILLLVLVSGCVQNAPAETPQNESNIVIGLSMATFRTERWATDRDIFVAKAKELGAKVNVMSADEDAGLQTRQAENMILQGVNAIVVIAQDGTAASEIVEKAHEAGIKVIAYDRLIKDSDLDYYISFDNEKVGEEEARWILNNVSSGNFAYIGGSPTDNNAYLVKQGSFKLLQPLIDNGSINLVIDNFTDNWDPEIA
jgi:D-xylose transport system substrate-binding protein